MEGRILKYRTRNRRHDFESGKVLDVKKLLSTMNDTMIAERTGLSRERVRQIRLREGIPIPTEYRGKWAKNLQDVDS
jgi:hypothetical protein